MIRVLFVCTGNICRSPTAEGVFRALAAEAGLGHAVEADSAGTHAYHVGEPPDARSCQAALARGVDLSEQRARQVRAEDFAAFDFILALDRSHLGLLRELAPAGARSTLRLFLDFAPDVVLDDVPDPYYGGGDGFEEVLDLVATAAAGLLDHIKTHRL